MNKIKLEALSKEERAELKRQLAAEEKAAKKERKENIATYKQLSAEFVKRNINKLIDKQTALESIVKDLFADYGAILTLKQMAYGEKTAKQDSHTSTLPNGSASITIGWNVSIAFDGTESVGVEKIKAFLTSLSDDTAKNKKLQSAVKTFLKPNAKTGMLNPLKIIELSKLRDEFNDERFNDGLEIIFNAQYRRRNSMYVSGWKIIQLPSMPPKKVEFRFTI